MRFQNKLFLIVGISSGIGYAVARNMAREGATIVGVGRNTERLEKVLQTLEGNGHQAIVADVSDENQMVPIINFGKDRGGYDGGVFCAGLHEVRPLNIIKRENMIKSYEANVITTFNCTKALVKAVSPNGAGVVWLSSIAAIKGTPGFITYAAAKGALISSAKVAALELAKKNIRVNVIVAGVVNTPMSEGWLRLLSNEQRDAIVNNHVLGIGQPEDVADAIAFLVSSEARWITGTTLIVDGGLSLN
ncbi:MAG: SDR family NAD(P)-dependent oxidoreductase [Bacillota bacterium]